MRIERSASRLAALGTGLAVLAIAGCGSSTNGTNSSSSASATSSVSSSASANACLVGVWNVDLQTLAPQTSALVKGLSNQQMTGKVTVAFTPKLMTTVYAAYLKGSQQVAGKGKGTLVAAMAGKSQSSYFANGTTMSVANTTGSIRTQQTVTVNGVRRTTNATTLYAPITDFTSESVAYTCTGNSLRLSNMAGFSLSAARAA